MKKIITLAAIALMTTTVQAQTEQKALYESMSYDNWYIGAQTGLSTKTTHSKWMENLNANAGARVGRWFTPAFGLAIEGTAYFGDKPQPDTHTIVKYVNTDLAATINLSNWWFGYQGEPRFFEVIAVPALGMGHVFSSNKEVIPHGLNDFTGKLAMDLAFNVDKKKCVQLYLEPALLYSIYGNAAGSNDFNMNINRSHFQLSAGLIYRFKNTNGTHNFKYAEDTKYEYVDNSSEIERLNNRIAALQKEIADKDSQLAAAQSIAPKMVIQEVSVAELDPTVLFTRNSSKIQYNQILVIERVASHLKDNADKNAVITGYASTEGKADYNQKLSVKRADAVKNMLVKKYGIDASRLTTKGNGATDKISEQQALNRVATITFTE